MWSRDIGCESVENARGKDICAQLSRNMDWAWTGHSIISPGYRVTWATIRTVYCVLEIKKSDLAALEALKDAEDWRLQSGAESLMRLIRGGEDEASIFNPENPDYILKSGCDKKIE